MAQWVKYLLCRPQDLSSDLQHLSKAGIAVILELLRRDRRKPETGGQASLVYSAINKKRSRLKQSGR